VALLPEQVALDAAEISLLTERVELVAHPRAVSTPPKSALCGSLLAPIDPRGRESS